MKVLRKFLTILLILSIIATEITGSSSTTISNSLETNARAPIKAGVLLYSADDLFLSQIRQDLENIEKENQDKIAFTFFDSKSNSAIQLEMLGTLTSGDFDILLLNIVEARENLSQDIALKIKQANIPAVIFASDLPLTDSYSNPANTAILASDPNELGAIEGKILADAWKSNINSFDKNKDNKLQYIMLQGNPISEVSRARTSSSISAIKSAGIQTEELTSLVANWDRNFARDGISSAFLRYDNKIEAIISNNDAMAIGAVEALQKLDYNKGDKSKFIPVVGIDGIEESNDLIRKGFMTGTAFQDSRKLADALYKVGMNLFTGLSPTTGTNYTMDNSKIIIPEVYESYTVNSPS
jgi:methyl-galactoside transport system substrate-binding protein